VNEPQARCDTHDTLIDVLTASPVLAAPTGTQVGARLHVTCRAGWHRAAVRVSLWTAARLYRRGVPTLDASWQRAWIEHLPHLDHIALLALREIEDPVALRRDVTAAYGQAVLAAPDAQRVADLGDKLRLARLLLAEGGRS
jgi:hypothetical protein